MNPTGVEYVKLTTDGAFFTIVGGKSTRPEGEIYRIVGFAADSPLYDGYSL